MNSFYTFLLRSIVDLMSGAFVLIIGSYIFVSTLDGATVSLNYDAGGNETSQQAANAAVPIITGQPNSKQIVAPGGSVGFSVSVASVLPVTYQWYFNGTAISGATSDSYFLTNFAAVMEGSYTVVATNSLGSVTSAVATPYIDSNGNGLPDSWEMQYFGNLNQAAGGDYDGDGITNIQEFFDGTNPTVRETLYWIASNGSFSTAANWNLNRVPGVGDTAVINSGTFTLPTNVTNTVSNVTVNAPFTAAAGSNYTLNIAGTWTFNGSVTLTSGYQFAVIGGGTATVAGITSIDGVNFETDGGSTLAFPNVTSATVPANLSVTWLAQNAGSTLNFPSLTSIAGPATPNNYLNLHVQYNSGTAGAVISLPVLTTITKADDGDQYNDSGVEFYAYDYGTISAPNLSTFNDNDSHPNSGLTAANNGVLSLPKLLAPQGVNSINVNAQSNPQQFTSLVGTSSFEVNAGTVAMSKLASITGFSAITVDNGAQLSFPNTSSYASPANVSVTWLAQNAGSTLSFPNLTSITGPATPNSYLNLHVQYNSGTTGAIISLPVLTTITKADDGDQYNDSGVEFYAYDYGTISAPKLSTFNDNDSHPNSGLTAANNGVLSAPKLLAPKGVNIDLDAQSNPQQFTSLAGTASFEVNSGTVTMSNLASITGFSSITVDNGAQLSFPNVTSYTVPAGLNVQWLSQHNGSTLSFPNLTTIAGPTTPNTYLQLVAQYDGNATISLPALTTITKADDGDQYNDSGVEFAAYSGGVISAPNLTTFNDSDSHPNSGMVAEGTGVISVPKLLAPAGVNINFNAVSNPQQFTSLTGTSSFEINAGSVTMSNLSSIGGFSSITVDNGAQLSFPKVTSYAVPTGLNVQWLSQHSGSTLTFPNLASIAGPTTPNTYLNLVAQYDGNATISLPVLTTITKADDGDQYNDSGVEFYAHSGGVISAPNLSTFQDNDSHPNSGLEADGTGVLSAPKLLAPKGVNVINLNALSTPQQFTSLVGTSFFEISGGMVVMSNLASIAGFSSITVDNGGQLSFPNVTSYTSPTGINVQWLSQHSGSTLSFPNLTAIAGPTTPGTYLSLVAQYDLSATISLPALTTITKADDGDSYADSGVQFTVSDGTISAPNLSNFHDNDSHPNSSLNASNGGVFIVTSLTQSGLVGVTLNGLTLPATAVAVPLVSQVAAGGNITMTVQTSTGHTYQLQQSSTYDPANWQSVGSPQTGTNGPVNFVAPVQGSQIFYRILITPWP